MDFWKRGERPVFLLVAAALLLVELTLGLARPVLSGDIRHLDEAEAIAESVADGDGLRLLVAGNSLIGEGIDSVLLHSRAEDHLDAPVTLGILRPDGTSPLEWRYLYRRVAFNRGDFPDALVIGFGPGHLRDRPAEASLLRLAVHHVDQPDVPTLFAEDVTSLESRVGFGLARYYRSFGLRDRISSRLLAAVIPSYRELAPTLLRRGAAGGDATGVDATYRHLEAVIREAQAGGVQVVLVAMPQPDSYVVDAGVMRLAEELGVTVLDINPVAGIGDESWMDPEHLNEEGSRVFTAALAEPLLELLSER